MSRLRGDRFPVENQEDLSSDESLSSRNISLYSRTDSENSLPQHEISESSSNSNSSTSSSSKTSSTEQIAEEDTENRHPNCDSSSTSSSTSSSGLDKNNSTTNPSSNSHIKHSLCLGASSEFPFHQDKSDIGRKAPASLSESTFERSKLLSTKSANHKQGRTEVFCLSKLTKGRDKGLLRKMYAFSVKYHKEICIVLFIIASGLPFLRSKPLKTRSVQTPGPFFDQKQFGVLVDDHYEGEYVNLVQKKIPQAPSFVFYYAPWDSECLAAKTVFLEVARHFRLITGDQVKFYAVNCWWPDGQCRQNYKNLSHYPIFVAHISGSAGIIYNGPIRAELMIRFLNLTLRPVTRIDTEDELWRFRAQHDAVMLAYFNFSVPESAEAYDIYLQMALRNLEADPLGQVGYGVFLRQSLAEKYFVTSSNSISLVLFNEIHTAKWNGGFPSQDMRAPIKQVADWVMERTKGTPITWAYRVRNGFSNRPVTLGPIDLAQELSNGPVLLLITRRYYPSAYSPFYAQVKEVALDYFNCNKSGNVTRLRRYTHKINAEWLKLWKSIQRICTSSKNATFNCEIMQEQLKNWKSSEVLLEREPLATFEKNISGALNFTGLSCRLRRPFRFIAIDPADVPHFIHLALGGVSSVAKSLTNQESLGFIIDAKNDFLFPLASFKTSDIALSIHNYSASVQSGESASIPLPNGSNGKYPFSNRLWTAPSDSGSGESSKKQVNVERLNAEELLALLEPVKENSALQKDPKSTTPVFIMYTAQFCGYCGVALAHFVSLARFLSVYSLNIRLARIDVFRNSLPANLTFGEIPSFLFLPAYNRSDIRIFPPGQEINAKNLLKFILGELDAKSRVELSLSSPICAGRSEKAEESPTGSKRFDLSLGELNGTRTTTRLKVKDLLGPEQCHLLNKVLVTRQINSVLKVLKSDLGISSAKLGKNSKSTLLVGEKNRNKHNYYNDDKLDFMRELGQDYSSHLNGEGVKSGKGNLDEIANGKHKSSKLITFQSESVAVWSHGVLDHLRSMRLFLDVM